MPRVIPIDASGAVEAAAEAIQRGELVVVPTDTVYGVACLPYSSGAIARLYAAKQRPPDKAIPVLLADLDAALLVAAQIPDPARRLAARFWPGALTMTLPKRDDLPANLSQYETVGVRVPDHGGCRAFLRALGGAAAVTSANRSGGPNPTTIQEAVTQLGETVAVYLDGGRAPGGVPSTVIVLAADGYTIARPGPITAAMLDEALLQNE